MDKETDDLINIKTDISLLKAKIDWLEAKVKKITLKFYAYNIRRNFIKSILNYWPIAIIFILIFFSLGVVYDEKIFHELTGKIKDL